MKTSTIGNMIRKELKEIAFIDKLVNDGFLVKEPKKEIFGISGREEILAEQEAKKENKNTPHWACGKVDCDCDWKTDEARTDDIF